MKRVGKSTSSCCGAIKGKRANLRTLHPDHSDQIARLNRAIGQLEGIKRMVLERRYCPEILVQTRAVTSALKAVELSMIQKHVRHCVTEALDTREPKAINRKIEELVTVLDRF